MNIAYGVKYIDRHFYSGNFISVPRFASYPYECLYRFFNGRWYGDNGMSKYITISKLGVQSGYVRNYILENLNFLALK